MKEPDPADAIAVLQWEAHVHQRIGGSGWRAAVLAAMRQANWADDAAARLVAKVVRRARVRATVGMIGFGLWALVATAITVGSYDAATSAGGTYIIWWGGMLGGGIGAFASLFKLLKTL